MMLKTVDNCEKEVVCDLAGTKQKLDQLVFGCKFRHNI